MTLHASLDISSERERKRDSGISLERFNPFSSFPLFPFLLIIPALVAGCCQTQRAWYSQQHSKHGYAMGVSVTGPVFVLIRYDIIMSCLCRQRERLRNNSGTNVHLAKPIYKCNSK